MTTTSALWGVGPKTAEERVAPASLSSLTAAVPVGQPLYGAMAFDACSAPSVTSMQAWRQSPYVAVGIYTSGSMRAWRSSALVLCSMSRRCCASECAIRSSACITWPNSPRG